MNLLIDTHILLWLLKEPDRLAPQVHDLLADAETLAAVSAASLWEVAIKRAVGKLTLPGDLRELLPSYLRETNIAVLSVTALHALSVAELPMHHRDPFDRLLIAQAQIEGVPVVTADRAFSAYDIEVIPATN